MNETPWYKTPTAWAVIIFVAFFIWGLARTADAAEVRLGIGGGVTNGNDWIVQEVALTDRRWYASAMLTGADDVQPNTWRFAGGYRVNWRDEMKVSPFLRLGAAYWRRRPLPLISDHWSYDMAVGVRLWRVVDLEWQHNSTAGRSDFNKGNDIVLLGLIFPF